ncbi:MAG TPA: hypothetical protein VMU86_05915, partial [Steroidobacteraceae bacterium]|nr:hypothetical protein [Steroidobacteraceae bacterium]
RALTLPERLLAILPPPPTGYPRTRESFPGHMGLAFDPQGAVAAAANLTCALLFEPTRATRLVEYHIRDAALPSLTEVIDATLAATWYAAPLSGELGETQETVQTSVLAHLLALTVNHEASGEARDIAAAAVVELKDWLAAHGGAAAGADLKAHRADALRRIERWEKRPSAFASPALLAAPPGQPIGGRD